MGEPHIPPHDADAEAAVLSSLMIDTQGVVYDAIADVLQPEQFYGEAHRRICEAIVDLARSGQPHDIVTVATWLRDRDRIVQIGGASYLTRILDSTPAVSAERVGAYAAIVREKWRMRRAIAICQRAAEVGYLGHGGGAQTFLDELERDIHDLAQSSEQSTVEHAGPIMKRYLSELALTAQRGEDITGIATGFTRIDKMTAGLHGGDLTIIAGRPGMGKTSYAMNICENVSLTHPENVVLVFSLEMPRKQIVGRLTCSHARVDVARMRSPRSMSPREWGAITSTSRAIFQSGIFIDDKPGVSLLEVRAKSRRLASEAARQRTPEGKPKKLAMIMVDYIQLMTGRAGAHSREQEISEISRGLKELAKELDIPVLALSQLNRSTETRSEKNKRPQLSDLRESGAIEQDADNVQFLYRAEYYTRLAGNEPPPDELNIAEVIIAKQRNGPTGTAKVRFAAEYTRFDNLEYQEFDS